MFSIYFYCYCYYVNSSFVSTVNLLILLNFKDSKYVFACFE